VPEWVQVNISDVDLVARKYLSAHQLAIGATLSALLGPNAVLARRSRRIRRVKLLPPLRAFASAEMAAALVRPAQPYRPSENEIITKASVSCPLCLESFQLHPTYIPASAQADSVPSQFDDDSTDDSDSDDASPANQRRATAAAAPQGPSSAPLYNVNVNPLLDHLTNIDDGRRCRGVPIRPRPASASDAAPVRPRAPPLSSAKRGKPNKARALRVAAVQQAVAAMDVDDVRPQREPAAVVALREERAGLLVKLSELKQRLQAVDDALHSFSASSSPPGTASSSSLSLSSSSSSSPSPPAPLLSVGALFAAASEDERLLHVLLRCVLLHGEQQSMSQFHASSAAMPLLHHRLTPTLCSFLLDSGTNAAAADDSRCRYSPLTSDFCQVTSSAAGATLYSFLRTNLAGGPGAWVANENALKRLLEYNTLLGFGIDPDHVGAMVLQFRRDSADPTSPVYTPPGSVTFWILVGDATRLRRRFCRGKSGEIYGAALTDEELANEFPGGGIDLPPVAESDASALHARLRPFRLASDVDIILGQPMRPGAAPYDLAAFLRGGGSKAKAGERAGFTPCALTFLARRAILLQILKEAGIIVLAFTSDGEAASTSAAYGTFAVVPAIDHLSRSPAHFTPRYTLATGGICHSDRYLARVTFRDVLSEIVLARAERNWIQAQDAHDAYLAFLNSAPVFSPLLPSSSASAPASSASAPSTSASADSRTAADSSSAATSTPSPTGACVARLPSPSVVASSQSSVTLSTLVATTTTAASAASLSSLCASSSSSTAAVVSSSSSSRAPSSSSDASSSLAISAASSAACLSLARASLSSPPAAATSSSSSSPSPVQASFGRMFYHRHPQKSESLSFGLIVRHISHAQLFVVFVFVIVAAADLFLSFDFFDFSCLLVFINLGLS